MITHSLTPNLIIATGSDFFPSLILFFIHQTKLFPARMPLRRSLSWDSIFLNRRHVVLASTDTPPKKPFPFLKLPSELRAMVYKPLIQDGDLCILRVSKLTNQEAVPLLSKVASLRVNLGRSSKNGDSKVTLPLTAEITLSGTLTLTAPDYIQHIDLRLDMTARVTSTSPIGTGDTNLIASFTGYKITRKSCKITVKFGTLGPIPYSGEKDAYKFIAALTGFMVLTLRLDYTRNGDRADSLSRRLAVSARFQKVSMLWEDYETVSKMLQDTLGPATLDSSVVGHCLKFSPLAYQRSKLLSS